jgi:hypothetical protein
VFGDFSKPVEKLQVSLKSLKTNGDFTLRPVHFYDNTALNFTWNEKILGKIKTHVCRL